MISGVKVLRGGRLWLCGCEVRRLSAKEEMLSDGVEDPRRLKRWGDGERDVPAFISVKFLCGRMLERLTEY